MIFGEIPAGTAAGSILAHGVRGDGVSFSKGRRLDEADCRQLLGNGRLVTQRAIELAAGQPLLGLIAQQVFDRTQRVRQAERRLQKTLVHRADFPGEGAEGAAGFATGEGGHAVDHGVPIADKQGRLV